jgi:hypothetical protein
MPTGTRILVLIGMTLMLASCGGKDLSEEKSRSSEEFKALQERMTMVQTDR